MASIRILGVDPGLNRTGWGVIESEGNRLRHIAHGVVTSEPSDALSARLSSLYSELAKIIVTWGPEEAAVEEVFVNRNPASTLKLGMARGIALLAPAMTGLTVAEYAANLVKKSVVGAGHADKTQIAMMVGMLLPGSHAKADAADALAVAICHAHHRGARIVQESLAPAGRGRDPRQREGEGAFLPKPAAHQIANARRLRQDGTNVEKRLWQSLRNEQLGIKFRRQAPVLNYIADFLSHEASLIVELDGGQHTDNLTDDDRTAKLEQAGFQVLRFWNNEVNENLDGVLQTIAAAIRPRETESLAPSGRGRGPQSGRVRGGSHREIALEPSAKAEPAPSPGRSASDLSPLGRGKIP
jgi:crossover junction endodeoxyribonuclease RuvC